MENERLIKSESIFIMKIVLYTNENHVCNFLFTVVHFVSNFHENSHFELCCNNNNDIYISGANDILEVIDLSWNQIRGKGAIAVAKGIGVSMEIYYVPCVMRIASLTLKKLPHPDTFYL